MILSLLDQGRPEVGEVGQALIGSEVWVGWPHLVEAKVVAVQSQSTYIDAGGEKPPPSSDGQGFGRLAHSIKSQYSNR